MTVITITYNEEFILPHFIKHYRTNFPNCRIIVYDNYSTDSTVEIAKANGCEVVMYDTGGKLSDAKYLEIKNNAWKGIDGWVIVCDADEFLDINQGQIDNEDNKGNTVIRSEGFNMVNLSDNLDFDGIKNGVRSQSYDKWICFDTEFIKEINYGAGCHIANPKGWVNISVAYPLRHYKYINIDYMIARHKAYGERLSDENLKRGWGGHYLYSPEQITKEFNEARKNSIRIL